MDKKGYDVISIGSGPGGEGADMGAAKRGLKVAIVEDFEEISAWCYREKGADAEEFLRTEPSR